MRGRQRRNITSGNTEPAEVVDLAAAPRRRRAEDFDVDVEDIRVDYAVALQTAPLAASTRDKYQDRVRDFLEWACDQAHDGRLRGDPVPRDVSTPSNAPSTSPCKATNELSARNARSMVPA